MKKRKQDHVDLVSPGRNRRSFASSLQARNAYDSASLEDSDAEMSDDNLQDVPGDVEAICYGAVSPKFNS